MVKLFVKASKLKQMLKSLSQIQPIFYQNNNQVDLEIDKSERDQFEVFTKEGDKRNIKACISDKQLDQIRRIQKNDLMSAYQNSTSQFNRARHLRQISSYSKCTRYYIGSIALFPN
ncbi:hypothetical protein FGO68_gene1245 [Halteria grandinella]|uniref:Uncharacterized protein n=1 Tax=Halteria grandinella TaxID=5974 RepID=A0A8J8NHC1_HALGN|nr:hypothetical protein FGO68_gene1245 [Halteria grandinella]